MEDPVKASAPALKGLTPSMQGYHRLAGMMAQSGDLSIFRAFGDLNMLGLFSLQAEILELRDDFYDICCDDERMGAAFSKSFIKLLESKDSQNHFQYEQLVKIRSKMKEYNELLLQGRLYLNPRSDYLEHLRSWLQDFEGGQSSFKGKEAFISEPRDIRGVSTEHDLVTVCPQKGEQDAFTKFLLFPSVNLYHRLWGHRHSSRGVIDEESGMIEYKEEKLEKIGIVLSTTLSSVLPVVAVLALYFEKDLLRRIYIMLGITAVFATMLAMFSNARRIEIFAATATFAAVEVVFIGGTSVHFGDTAV